MQLIRYWNILSLDVATGAVVCAAFFANQFQAPVRVAGYLALFGAVWMIYTIDHLADGYALGKVASTARHYFHQKYFWAMLVVLACVGVAEIILLFFIAKPVFQNGLWLSLLMLGYLLLNQKLRYWKEIFVAVLYCCGVLLPALSLTTLAISSQQLISVAIFLLLVMQNVLLFAWMEGREDVQDGRMSLATLWSGARLKRIIAILFGFIAVALVVGWMWIDGCAAIAFSSMAITLLLVFVFHHCLRRVEAHRYIGEAVFLFPIFCLL